MTTEPAAVDPLLTQIIVMPGGNRIPLMMEVPVSRDLDGPFLLCSSKSLLWVEQAFPNSMVRTAIRIAKRRDLFSSAIPWIAQKAIDREWGSVHLATKEGVTAAFSHLADYDIIDVEVVYGEGFDTSLFPEDVTRTQASWMPAGWAAVLPSDRSFLGTLFEYDGDQYGMVVHNAPRGIAIVKPDEA